jgi:FG-GAP-like repeat/FG-GAP repeat/EF hand
VKLCGSKDAVLLEMNSDEYRDYCLKANSRFSMNMKLIFLIPLLFFFASVHAILAQNTSFLLSSSPLVGNAPSCLVAADVNGDGKVDFITTSGRGPQTVSTNDGNGGLAISYSSTWVVTSYSICAADVNGDGKLDLIAADWDANWLRVFTNDGSGGFRLASIPGCGVYPDSVCAADVNGDGKVDLIVANDSPAGSKSTVTILTNDGSGGFEIASSPSVGSAPQYVVAADINGDGKVDLICANYYDNVSILTNDGSGNFAFASSPPGTYQAESLIAADINGDGKIDFVLANEEGYSSFLTVMTNDGSGGFAPSATLSVIGNMGNIGTIGSVCAADVNGDGKMDLIYTSYFYDQYLGFTDGSTLTVATNDGNGNFVLANSLSTDTPASFICAADVNGDGKADLIEAIGYNLSVFTNATIFLPPTSTPSLTITALGAQTCVSWPLTSPGWSLQQNPDLTTMNWNPSGYNGFNISDDGTNKSLTLPTEPGNLFFRLLHP